MSKTMQDGAAIVRAPYQVGERQLLNNSWPNLIEIVALMPPDPENPPLDHLVNFASDRVEGLRAGDQLKYLNGIEAGRFCRIVLENGQTIRTPDPNPPAVVFEYQPDAAGDFFPITQPGIDLLKREGGWREGTALRVTVTNHDPIPISG